jgi:hypothetical protein
MTVRVALSKVSAVALRVRRGSRVILARDLTLRRGTHGFTLKPSRRGTLTVDVEARDLAGNAASVGRTVRVAATS